MKKLSTSRAIYLIACLWAVLNAAIAWRFGQTLGFDASDRFITGGVMVLMSIATFYLLDLYIDLKHFGRKFFSGTAAVLFVGFIASEVICAYSFTAFNRTATMNEAKVSNARYEEADHKVDEAKERLEFFTGRLDELRKANAWAATTTPDALAAKIESMEGDKVFRRSKQCANVTRADSRAFCDQYADAKAQHAIIAEMNKLPGQIEATQKVVDEARAAIKTEEIKTVGSAAQATAIAQAVSLFGSPNLAPSKDDVTWVALFMSGLLSLFMAMPGILKALVNPRLQMFGDDGSLNLAAPAAPGMQKGFVSGMVDKFDGPTGETRKAQVSFNVARTVV